MITTAEKVEIYETARAQMREWYGDDLANHGACLYWTQVALRTLLYRGHRAILQAGTMFWKIAPDSAEVNAFGYEWSPHTPFSQALMAQGQLPEIHIWAALPDEMAIVDFSTAYLPRIAKEQYGFDWILPPPPDYIFGRPPENCFYKPIPQAIRFAVAFINRKVMEDEPANVQ